MGYSYNISTPLNINGDTSIPSRNLYVGGNITGNANIYITGTISGNVINGATANISNINAAGTISGNNLIGNGSGITNLSTSAMPNAFLIDGSRQMTGSIVLNNNILKMRSSSDNNNYVSYYLNTIDGTKTLDGTRIAGNQGVELAIPSAGKTMAVFQQNLATIGTPLTVNGSTTINSDLTLNINSISNGIILNTTGVNSGWARGITIMDSGNNILAGAGFYGATTPSSNTMFSFAIKLSNNWWNTPNLEVKTTGVNINGNQVWHAGNMGPGSGLNADLLDGLDSTAFIKADGSISMTGDLSIGSYSATGQQYVVSGGVSADRVNNSTWYGIGRSNILYGSNSGNATGVQVAGYYGLNLKTSNGEIVLDPSFSSAPKYNGYAMWHSGNQGSGSGMNADMVDGIHATGFALSPNGYTTGNAILSLDSRNSNYNPQDRPAGLYADFKLNTTDGLSDGG